MKKITILCLLFVSLTACVGASSEAISTIASAEVLPTRTFTLEPSGTPQPTSRSTALPTKTLVSTKYIYSTSTKTLTPTATFIPSLGIIDDFTVGDLSDSEEFDPGKPWVVYQEYKPDNLLYYYLINLDGSGKTLLFSRTPSWFGDRRCKVSPDHQFIACTPADDEYSFDQELIVFSLQQMKIIFRTPLIASSVREAGEELLINGRDLDFQFSDPVTTLIACGDFQWSPDSKYLAFTSSFEGSTSDIYVYDVAANSSKRLTDGLGETSIIDWSPDSEWILHSSWVKRQKQRMDSTVLPVIEKIWMVNPESEQIQLLETINWDSAQEEVLAWISESKLIVMSRMHFNLGPSISHIRQVDLLSHTSEILYEDALDSAAFNPLSETLVIHNESYSDFPGIHIIYPDSTYKTISENDFSSVDWFDETGWFSAPYFGENKIILFTSDGEIVDSFSHEKEIVPSVSPDGKAVVFKLKNDRGDMGLRVYSVDGEWTYHILPNQYFCEGKYYWFPDSSAFIYIQTEGAFRGIIYYSFLDSELVVWEENLEGSYFDNIELWRDPVILP